MSLVAAPFFYRWLSPKYLVCDLPCKEKIIYLTFDDGPIPEATPAILTILKQYQATASFFVVGDNVRRYPDIFQQVIADGHAIGNHTFHHLDGWKTSPGAYLEDVTRCRDLFTTRLFRPPHGRFTPTQYFLLKNDFRFILWSVLSCDFDQAISPDRCLQNALSHTRQGSKIGRAHV